MARNYYYVYYELKEKWGNNQSGLYNVSADSEFNAVAEAKKYLEEKVRREQREGYEITRVEKRN